MELQGRFNIRKSITVIHHNSRLKVKPPVHVNYTEKIYICQNLLLTDDKNSLQSRNRKKLNPIKAIYKMPTFNSVNDERLNAFLLRLGTDEVCPLIKLLFNVLPEVLVREACH